LMGFIILFPYMYIKYFDHIYTPLSSCPLFLPHLTPKQSLCIVLMSFVFFQV
jgi:hypothetical protein